MSGVSDMTDQWRLVAIRCKCLQVKTRIVGLQYYYFFTLLCTPWFEGGTKSKHLCCYTTVIKGTALIQAGQSEVDLEVKFY